MKATSRFAVGLAALLLASCSGQLDSVVPEPSPSASSARPEVLNLNGRSSLRDARGDLRDHTGEIASRPQLGVDLVEVIIEARDGRMYVGFVTAGPIPSESGPGDVYRGLDELVWRAEFYRPDAPSGPFGSYGLRAHLLGNEWDIRVVDLTTREQHRVEHGGPIVQGNRLTISAPLAMFPALPVPFEWSALTYWDNETPEASLGSITAGRDDVPDEGSKSRPAFAPTSLPTTPT